MHLGRPMGCSKKNLGPKDFEPGLPPVGVKATPVQQPTEPAYLQSPLAQQWISSQVKEQGLIANGPSCGRPAIWRWGLPFSFQDFSKEKARGASQFASLSTGRRIVHHPSTGPASCSACLALPILCYWWLFQKKPSRQALALVSSRPSDFPFAAIFLRPRHFLSRLLPCKENYSPASNY